MAATMFLQPAELAELTGKTRSDGQRRALLRMGIPFRVRPDGAVLVLRALVEVLFGASGSTISTLEPEVQP